MFWSCWCAVVGDVAGWTTFSLTDLARRQWGHELVVTTVTTASRGVASTAALSDDDAPPTPAPAAADIRLGRQRRATEEAEKEAPSPPPRRSCLFIFLFLSPATA